MSTGENKYSTVGKAFEIDRAAIKIFEGSLPNNWLARKQDPDFFLDYLVEIVEAGEPTALHFAAQVKGFEGSATGQNPLTYSFKTKHLKYYLRNQHPIFLFLINVTSGEGFWVFAQKHIKEKVSAKILNEQDSVTIHFPPEDNLQNSTKFKCLLPEAEQFVRDLHPGSVTAALEKRKTELESKDPRCEVSISIKDGKEQVSIAAKENFSFKAQVRSKNLDGWRKFFECGTAIKLEPGEMVITGAPLLEEALKKMEAGSTLQFGQPQPASVQIFGGAGENLTLVQIDGTVTAGTKFITFNGRLSDSPVEMTAEFPINSLLKDEASTTFTFLLDNWTGQQLLLFSHFDQIEALVRSLVSTLVPKMQVFFRGNVLWSGLLNNMETDELKKFLYPVEWIKKCRWIAQQNNLNPKMPCVVDVSDDQWENVEMMYGLLKNNEFSVPQPGQIMSFVASTTTPQKEFESSGTLTIDKEGQTVDFFGAPVHIGPTRTTFNDMKFISRTPTDRGGEKFVFETTDTTKRTTIMISK